MNKKNKVMLGLAIGAVVLCVASGVARCSMTQVHDEPQQAQQEAVGQIVPVENQSEGTDAQADSQGGFAGLKNTMWETEDGKSALSIIDGAFIERSEDGNSKILYYTLSEEQAISDGLSATLKVSETMTGDEHETVLLIEEDSGTRKLTCDALAASYIEKTVEAASVTVEGITEELCSVLGFSKEEIEETLIAAAPTKAKGATKVIWDGEVWLDFNNKSAITNFTANDASSTILTLQKTQDNKLVVL